MDRRQFLGQCGTSIALVAMAPTTLWAAEVYSANELTGRAKPVLEGDNFFLRPEAAEAFTRMRVAAQKDGIQLHSEFSYRDFDRQRLIWNNKYRRYISKGLTPQQAIKKIVAYSSLPGTSRHHWGTDVDIVDAAIKIEGSKIEPLLYKDRQPYAPLRKWLAQNAQGYGFFEVYTNEPDRPGFRYEPWHYSYRPLSKPIMKEFLKLDLTSILKAANLIGNEYLTEEFIEHYTKEYIMGINHTLLP